MGLYNKFNILKNKHNGTWFVAKTKSEKVVGISTSKLIDYKTFNIDGFIHPSTCTAFCAAVERESSTPSKFLVTWETLADVRLSGGQQLDPTTQVLRATKLSENKIFISCGMSSSSHLNDHAGSACDI